MLFIYFWQCWVFIGAAEWSFLWFWGPGAILGCDVWQLFIVAASLVAEHGL